MGETILCIIRRLVPERTGVSLTLVVSGDVVAATAKGPVSVNAG